MPLPYPELMGEVDGMFAGCVEELACRERHGRGVEDVAGDADEGDDQDDFERIDNVVGELRRGYIETDEDGDGEAKQGGAAQDGIDADEKPDCNAPG